LLPEELCLTNGDVELRVATGYGPRVTHYGFAGGANVFGDGRGASRETPRGLWRAYGGHRLWAVLRVRCDASQPAPAKIGAANERGWFAYLRERTAFLVRTTYDAAAEYPDRGASVEMYTEGGFCEVETLGPLVTLAPGERAEHDARWSLVVVDDRDETALARFLEGHAAR
jgi:hypothetical protein